MRVLHVLEAIEAGVARHVTDVVGHVDAEHHVLVPPERVGGFTDLAAFEGMEAAGARVHLQPMRRSVVDHRNVAAMVAARRLIRRSRPDVVHGHASIGGAIARVAATGTSAARVYTPNSLLPGRAATMAERQLGRLTDGLVAVSATEAELIARLRIVPPERITVIPNGIDLAAPAGGGAGLRSTLGIDPAAPLVGSIGRLAPQKAPEVFVRACARIARGVPAARFVLIGDGPLRSLVESEVRGAGLEESFVLIPGMQRAAAAMAELDVLALASRYEAGPYVPLEAMRAGTPVVLTDVVGNRDTVVDGESGLIVPPDDPEALAAAALRLLEDGTLRERLVEGGRARLAERFDVRMMAKALGELYRSVASARRRKSALKG